jgi:hypothetical protein
MVNGERKKTEAVGFWRRTDGGDVEKRRRATALPDDRAEA